jgi:hypothetical protein
MNSRRFLFKQFFDSEVGGGMISWNVSRLLTDYTELYRRG